MDQITSKGSQVSITQFNRGQAARIFNRLHRVDRLIVLKNNQPTAVILSPKEYRRICEIAEDCRLWLEASSRLAVNDFFPTVSMTDVMADFGISAEDLTTAPDAAIE